MKVIIIFYILIILSSEISIKSTDFINISGDNMVLTEDGTQIIKGNVRLIYENTILRSEKAKYNNSKNILEAFDNINAEDKDYILKCNYLITYMDKKYTIAKQNPYIIEKIKKDKKQKDLMLLKADIIEIFSDENRILASGNVILTKKPKKSYDSSTSEHSYSTMWSDSLEMFMNDNRSIAKGNVRIRNKDFEAFADQAMYYTDEQKLILTGNTHAIQKKEKQENKVFGQKIIYFFDTERVIIVKARADVFTNTKKENEKK